MSMPSINPNTPFLGTQPQSGSGPLDEHMHLGPRKKVGLLRADKNDTRRLWLTLTLWLGYFATQCSEQ